VDRYKIVRLPNKHWVSMLASPALENSRQLVNKRSINLSTSIRLLLVSLQKPDSPLAVTHVSPLLGLKAICNKHTTTVSNGI